MPTPHRRLSVQTIAHMDDSQRSLLRALGYDVPEAADAAESDSSFEAADTDAPISGSFDHELTPPQNAGRPS